MPATSAGMTLRALFLRRRGYGGLFFGLCRLVHALDFRVCAQLGDQVRLRLAHYEIFNLRLYILEFRGLFCPLVLNLDDMPTELGFDGVRNLAGFQFERSFGEFGHHLILGEISEVAT